MGGMSATEQRYADNMSATGLHPTSQYRYSQQPAQRTMSLSSRNLRNYDSQPRTMSLSMRSTNPRYSSQPISRTSSINSASVKPRITSRTNSMNARSRYSYNKQIPQRSNSVANSRNNSLTSSIAHTKIIKTTKETDMDGRTRSITTTTIEQRGDMKIVRTTVIQPSDAIDEVAELEDLAEIDDEFANFDEETEAFHNEFDEFDEPYDGGNLIDKHHASQNTAALAANAAAAALGMNSQSSVKYQSPKQKQLKNQSQQRERQIHYPNMGKQQYSPVTSPVQRKNEVKFHSNTSDYLSSPNQVQVPNEDTTGKAGMSQSPMDIINTEGNQLSPTDSFQERANKRLSQIQEVTEIYDVSKNTEDSDSKHATGGITANNRESLGSPFPGFTGAQPPQLHVNPTNSTLNSADDQYVEAQEVIIPDPPAVTNINESPSNHTYRNLAKVHVIEIPTPPTSGNPIEQESKKSTNYQQQQQQQKSHHQQDVDSFVSQQTPRKLKSVLKNSNSSVSSSNYGDSQPRFSQQFFVKQERQQPMLPESTVKKDNHSPEEMYAMAMKAAEKKVYGDRLNQIYVQPPLKEDIDNTTLENTLKNVHATSGAYQSSHPGEPYTSNASGLGFKLHSLRDAKDVKSVKRSERQDNGKKKFFKNEQKAQRKKWEQERRAIAESNNPITEKISENVESMVNRMPVDPAVELEMQQQQREQAQPRAFSKVEESPKKSKFGIFKLGKKKDNYSKQHKKSTSLVSQDSAMSTSSATKKKFFSFGRSDKHNDEAEPVMQVKETKPIPHNNVPVEPIVIPEEPVTTTTGVVAVENMETIPEDQPIQHEAVTNVDIPAEVPLADTAATTESSGDEQVLSQPPVVNIITQEEVYTDAVTGLEPVIAEDSTTQNPQETLLKETHVSQIPSDNVESSKSKKKSHSNGKSGSKLLRFFNL